MPADTATSVVIAAHNAEATLDRAIRSALAQFETAQVIVVDDASEDGSAALAHAWAAQDSRVTCLSQPTNQGPAAARNRALDEATSPWIAILDADDEMSAGRLAALHAHAATADFVADQLVRVASPDHAPAAPYPAFAPAPITFERFVLGNLGRQGDPLDLGFLKPLFRRDFVNHHNLRYREDMRLGEDYEFYARALLHGARFLIGGEAGYISLERPGSLSKRHGARELRALRDCDTGLGQVRALTPSEREALKRHWHSVDCRLQWAALVDAVKARDVVAAASAFHTLQSARFLSERLLEQAWLRSRAALVGPARRPRGHE